MKDEVIMAMCLLGFIAMVFGIPCYFLLKDIFNEQKVK